MKRLVFICLIVCISAVVITAQDNSTPVYLERYEHPFRLFDNDVKKEIGGFNGDKMRLSESFGQERRELFDTFEAELWKYLGNDVEKHYWIGAFLNSKSYLHGDKPLPVLAFNIWQNGIKLTENKEDEESIKRRYGLMILAAVLAEQLGKKDIAVTYKNEVESLRNNQSQIVAANFPAMSEYEICIFNNIGKDTSICKEEIAPQKEIKIISAGVVNGRAVELPKPIYPKNLIKKKIYGQVIVKVIIGFDGQVIFAEAIQGVAKLFEVSVEAAKKAKFSPTILSGKPVKVSGVIVYNFVK